MSEKQDDLEAVRVVATALEPFNTEDRHRIIRWASEKLGLTKPAVGDTSVDVAAPSLTRSEPRARSIKEFVNLKDPQSENQFAAAVAYYYRFEVAESQKKETITRDDLLEACRLADRPRLRNPAQTLVNAHGAGLLDRGEKGTYSINTVGENLVAMTLPAGKIAAVRTVMKHTRRGSKAMGKRK